MESRLRKLAEVLVEIAAREILEQEKAADLGRDHGGFEDETDDEHTAARQASRAR